jgi:hypothetical protein
VYIISILPVFMKSWTAHRRLVYVKNPFSWLLTVQFSPDTLNISSQYQYNVWEKVFFCDLFSIDPSLIIIHSREMVLLFHAVFLFCTVRNFLMVGLTSFRLPWLLYVPGHLISRLCQWCILFLTNMTLWYQIFSPWVFCEVIILFLLCNGILSCVPLLVLWSLLLMVTEKAQFHVS